MGLIDRAEAMAQLEQCKIEVFPVPQEGEVAVKVVADCSLVYWEVKSGKLNGDTPVLQLDNDFYDQTVRETHARLCTVSQNFHLPYEIKYVTDSGAPPLPKIRRKKVQVSSKALQRKLEDADRPTILASDIAQEMRHEEPTVIPYLFDHVPEADHPPAQEAETILQQVANRGLLPAKTMTALKNNFSLSALCTALNKEPIANDPASFKRPPQPWKRLLEDTHFRRNQIGRCNERLYAMIMAGSLSHARLKGMYHEEVGNDDGSRRLLSREEIGEADYLISNETLEEGKIIVIVTSDSDQIVYFLLRHAHLRNTVIWYENQKEGRFYNLSLLRTIPGAEEVFRQRALAYVLAGTDFVDAKVVGSSSKILASMQQMAHFSLSSVWNDRDLLVQVIERVMLANESHRKQEKKDKDGKVIPFSSAKDVVNNLFYFSGDLFRLFPRSTQ